MPFVQTDYSELAFRYLKEAFTQALLLVYYNPTIPLQLKTDISNYAVSRVYSQKQEDTYQYLITFYSRKLTLAEINYSTPNQELLAIVISFQVQRKYFEGAAHRITVITDYYNLKSFLIVKTLSRRQAYQVEFLSIFNFEI